MAAGSRSEVYQALLRWQVLMMLLLIKNVATKIMSKCTGLQHIGFIGFAICHWRTGYYPVAGGLCLSLC